MRCSNCGTENATGSRFCNQCGTPLHNTCPKCAVGNALDAKFCSQCGASLVGMPEAGRESQTCTRALAGERRHLTVLFCDLVDATEITARLDPEQWRELLAAYHGAAAEAISRYGGHVAKYLGDGVMAFFGYPEAHDNDAERAVRAGLQLLDSLARLNETRARPRLAARIGIDSGAVVVGAGTGHDADAFGDTPNIAELRRWRGDPAMGESEFRKSIALAQAMSAKSWELHDATFLARVLRDTESRDEAGMMLAEIYNWFSEGLDTADLKDAKVLLDELQKI